jgi:TRAP-type C4-dicarboxylate transport system substrate-binding protein
MIAALISSTAVAEELSAVGTWSNVQVYQEFEEPFWTEKLSDLTNGEFTAQITSLDQMGIAGDDVYRMLGDGVFDVGTTIADYAVSDAPGLEGLDVPLLASTPTEARAMIEAAAPMVEGIMRDRFNSQSLGIIPHAPQVLFCREEIRSLADLKNRKVRGSGRMTTKFLEALGAEGVNLAFSEVPGSLERGVIDCAVTGSSSGYGAGWWEVTDYVVNMALGGWDPAVVAINADRYDAMTAEQQETLKNAVTEGLVNFAWDAAEGGLQQDFACLTGNGDCAAGTAASMTLVELSSEDVAAARQVLIDVVLPEWAERAGPEVTAQWNDTVGKIVDVTISQ